jgi:NAD(P)-dependent dehydrogenase (short-subunit alcohol dehydrogenase family)
VINASVNAMRPEVQFADCNASKAAAASLAATLAMEWSTEGSCVTCLCPGYFRPSMTARYLDDPQTASELLTRIRAGRFGTATNIGATVESSSAIRRCSSAAPLFHLPVRATPSQSRPAKTSFSASSDGLV